MAPKGGTCFLLFMVAFTVLAQPPSGRKKCDFQRLTKKLISKCREKGYPAPPMTLLKTIFSNSDMPMKDGDDDPSEILLSSFQRVMNSATEGKNKSPGSQNPMDVSDEMKNKKMNGKRLSAIAKRMRDAAGGTDASTCHMQAFLAPLAWEAFIRQSESELDLDESESLLWASEPVLEESPSARMTLPDKVDIPKMKALLGLMIRKSCNSSSDSERSSMAKWALEQIHQNKFNCIIRPPSDSPGGRMNHCKLSGTGLSADEFKSMGPYGFFLPQPELDRLPKEKLCGLFRSGWFKSMTARAKPSVCNKFVQRHKECFGGKFPEQLDKLGPLVCCLDDLPPPGPDLSSEVLLQLQRCEIPSMNRIKRPVFDSFTSNSSKFQNFFWQGVTGLYSYFSNPNNTLQLPQNQVLMVTEKQQCDLVKKKLGDKCDKFSYKEMTDVQAFAKAISVCKIKHLKAKEMLENTEVLKNMIKRMRKGPLKAMVRKLRGNLGMLPDPLSCHVSLTTLKKVNNSLGQMKNKTWCRSQALFLVKKWFNEKQPNFRKMRSLLGGVTCKMMEKSADMEDFALAAKENRQWVCKHQLRCAARQFFANLENGKKDYFKTITEDGLDKIPTNFLLHLPPSKVMDLPDSVCETFLDKMEKANLSSLPLRTWSRPALVNRTLSCLANDSDLSGLTTADLFRLKPLICDLPPFKLRLMAPDVLNKALEMMASCCHIPPRHIAPLKQLLTETFGDTSGWKPETMETFGLPLFLDDEAAPALPRKPLMKAVVKFLMSSCPAKALTKKYCQLVTADSANATEQYSNSGPRENITSPTVTAIEDLPACSCFWSPAQLELISNDTFMETAETLGACSKYSADQLAALRKKAAETFGAVSQITECQLVQMGCITRGFSDSELEQLPFSMDTVEQLNHCGWTESQMKRVWKGVAKRSSVTARQLESEELVSLNRFICGLDLTEIQELSTDAFMDAVGSMECIKCPFEKLQKLTERAVSAFGDPSTWTEAEVSAAGDFVAGLTREQLASLNPSVFPFFSPCSIPQIPPEIFRVLSGDQLRAFGSDIAARVTLAQRAELSETQLAALEEAETEARNQPVPNQESEGSGAPSLSVEGLSAFMKPLSFLFMGFLLL